jgi:ribose transport system permease protein
MTTDRDDAVRTTTQDGAESTSFARRYLGRGASWWARAGEVRNLGLILVLVVLLVVGAVTAPDTFPTWSNARIILITSAPLGVVTIGMTFVIISGGIDLSVGAIVALASVWCTTAATQDFGVGGMIFTAITVGVCTGLVNGILIGYIQLVPFIVTLAMLVSARGLAQRISESRSQRITEPDFRELFIGDDILGLPRLVWILGIAYVLGWILLNRTTFGRRTFAIGGNLEAARLSGIDVRRQTALIYTLSGLCCGIAALMITARTNTGVNTHGSLWELDAIAAVIIGGTLLTGGRGTLVGSFLGVVIFTTITSIFTHNNLPIETQNIAKGLIIIGAVLLQRRAPARSGP